MVLSWNIVEGVGKGGSPRGHCVPSTGTGNHPNLEYTDVRFGGKTGVTRAGALVSKEETRRPTVWGTGLRRYEFRGRGKETLSTVSGFSGQGYVTRVQGERGSWDWLERHAGCEGSRAVR